MHASSVTIPVIRMRRHVLLLLAVLLAWGGVALPAAASGWYQIELLLFRGQTLPEGGTEIWSGTNMPNASGAVALQDPADTRASVVLVSPGARRLNAHRLQLARSGRYEPLLHRAWRQPVEDESRAQTLYFQLPEPDSGRTGPPLLTGTIRVSRGRFLHADLDVALREPGGAGTSASASPAGETTPEASRDRIYRMRESRRMRSGELHYLDHPTLGALLQVTPLAPEPAPAAEAESVPPADADAAGAAAPPPN